MSTTTNNDSGVVFRSWQQYLDYYKEDEPMPDYTGKSEAYVRGAEMVRKAIAELDKQRAEEEERKRRRGWLNHLVDER